MSDENNTALIALTAEIVSAHVANNEVSTGEIAALIHSVHLALTGATAPAVPDAAPQKPAVSIRSSVQPDYIVCLEDGAKVLMLKRYLRTRFDLSPDEYRAKWGLPRDYPMNAPNYREKRRAIAQKIGLGRKKSVADDVIAPAIKAKLKLDMSGEKPKRGRPPKASVSTSEALEKARARVSKPEQQPEAQTAPVETPEAETATEA